jgi:beta-glucosidase
MRCLAPAGPPALLAPSATGSPGAACVERAQKLVAQMTLLEKLAQMLQPERAAVQADDVARLGFGSILSGGGSNPTPNTPAAWAAMVTQFHSQSLASRLQIPLLYGSDAVHGHNNVHGAVIFPHNIGLGASRDPDLVTRIGRATALEVAATGVDWTFSPVVAAARDERWGRTYEAFGETPELAALLGPALIRGLQGERLGARPDGVLACAKHFLADGYTELGKDQGNATISAEVIERDILPVYQKAVEAGVGSIMVSFSSIDRVKMHCHGPLLNDALKGKLGFQGFLVSDWQGIEQLPGDYPTQLAQAINAGMDMVMAPKSTPGYFAAMQEIVPSRVPMARIDDAAARIVAAKCALGRLEPRAYRRTPSGGVELPSGLSLLGSASHRMLAREAVQKSLVLLQNRGDVLPIQPSVKRIHLAGSHADDIGNQSGGWTISWQGESGAITTGTSLRQAFEKRSGLSVSHSLDGSGAAGAELIVVAIGERPYAEGRGDNAKLEFDAKDLELVSRMAGLKVPLVVVLMTGRPLILGELPTWADALVAAWLPGSEADGITDVLFGDEKFVGKLPHSWPRSLAQVPINQGDASYDPLFPYGFGLSYGKPPATESASTSRQN